uniref:Uncharacterized protein n=2 Tax=Macaca TaxID=9539 RepID=Q2PFL4_MACFA|nr:hypothetical protein [Macaca fascicularis]
MFQTVPQMPVLWSRRPRSLASEDVKRKQLELRICFLVYQIHLDLDEARKIYMKILKIHIVDFMEWTSCISTEKQQ